MKPAAVYLRVSKDDGSQTTDNQRPEVMQMASGRGYEVAPEHVYEDQASGAKGADERPALRRLLDDAARGRFRAVFVWRLDRLSRDNSFYGGALMIAELDRFGVAILSHQQTWLDTSGPMRNALVQFSFELAADERGTLIKRTNLGIARARRQLARGPYWREKNGVRKLVTGIGRPRALVSDAMLQRAMELRAGSERGSGEPKSWRDVWRLLLDEFENVPSHASIARACTKGGAESVQGAPCEPGTSG